jgi:hypothetical protein
MVGTSDSDENELDRIPMTEEEIQQILDRRKRCDNAVRQRDKQLMQEFAVYNRRSFRISLKSIFCTFIIAFNV